MDQVFGRVEPWRVAGRMPKAEGIVRQRHLLCDVGQPLLDTRFHLFAVDFGIVEQKGQVFEALLQINQGGQHNNPYHRFRRALFFKVHPRAAALHVNGQKAIEFLPVAFVAPDFGLGVFFGPRIMRVRRALQREFIQGDQGAVFTGLRRFFLSQR